MIRLKVGYLRTSWLKKKENNAEGGAGDLKTNKQAEWECDGDRQV
jgi:hypothetical protein